MMGAGGKAGRIRFGAFELDRVTGQLARAGVPVRLAAQPTQVLLLLAERAGDLVERDEIGRRLWGDRWAEFDGGISTCIAQIRSVLGDNAGRPVYIETVPRRGYRFIAPVESLAPIESWTGSHSSDDEADNAAVVSVRAGSSLATALYMIGPLRRAAVLTLLVVVAALAIALATILSARLETGDRPMLAVLPFDVLDADPTLAFLGAGLTEELTVRLANLDPERIGVIARTSSAAFEDAPIAEVRRRLGVDYVVSGALRTSAGRVRITVQLVRTSDESHVWAHAFDRALSDVIDTQREVAQRVGGALSVRLAEGDRAVPSSPARLATLEARWLLDGGDPAVQPRAIALLDSAIALDSEYAPAWTARARLHWSSGEAERARNAARRALALDEDETEGRLILANLLYQADWDWKGAQAEFDRALAAAPGRADAHNAYALFLSAAGREEAATAHIEEALRLDPVSTIVLGDAALVYYRLRDFEQAEALATRVLSLDADNLPALSLLANIASIRGDRDRTVGWGVRLASAIRGTPAPSASPDVERDFNEFWNAWISWWRLNASGPLRAYQVAVGYAHLGQTERAIASLESGLSMKRGGMIAIRIDPAFDAMRDDARFRRIVTRIAPARLD